MLLLIDLVPLALAVLASMLLLHRTLEWQRLDEARVRAATEAAFAAAGLRVEGNALGFHVARLVEDGGVEVTADGVARVAVPLLDQIVCKVSEVDIVMGPLPAVPRVRTGHAHFDAEYAVFVGVSGGGPAGSYRAAPAGGDTPWAQLAILDALQSLGLQRMRVREGQAELTFVPALPIEARGRVARLALAVERAANGKPLPWLGPSPAAPLPPRSGFGGEVVAAWLASAVIGSVAGVLLSFTAPLRAVDAQLCGPGDEIAVMPSIGGPGVYAWCPLHPHRSSFMQGIHYSGGVLLGASMAVVLACAVLLLRLKSQARSHAHQS